MLARKKAKVRYEPPSPTIGNTSANGRSSYAPIIAQVSLRQLRDKKLDAFNIGFRRLLRSINVDDARIQDYEHQWIEGESGLVVTHRPEGFILRESDKMIVPLYLEGGSYLSATMDGIVVGDRLFSDLATYGSSIDRRNFVDLVRGSFSASKGPLQDRGESLESRLLSRFPDLSEEIAHALSELETHISSASIIPGCRNNVVSVFPEVSVPFMFKMYPNQSQQQKEATLLEKLSAHVHLKHYIPQPLASESKGDMHVNVIENVHFRNQESQEAYQETIRRHSIYHVAESVIRRQIPNFTIQDSHENQILYTLAMLHEEGSKSLQGSASAPRAEYPHPELVRAGMKNKRDLPDRFVDRAVGLYTRLLCEKDGSYEITTIHGDPVWRNTVNPSAGGLILPPHTKNSFLIDWESAGEGGMSETDLIRSTFDAITFGKDTSNSLQTYRALRFALSGNEKWIDRREFKKQYDRVHKYAPMDMARMIMGIGNWYMHDPYQVKMRDALVTKLERVLD